MLSKGEKTFSFFLRKFLIVQMAFILSFFYWSYLFFNSMPQIANDAIGYQWLGELLYNKGLLQYIEAGPSREPLYPFLISLAMRMADCFNVPYIAVQKIFQIFILFIAQYLFYRLLKRLNVHRSIIFISVLYFGFSPAIANSAFSLYSEIITYPFILGIILINAMCWRSLTGKGYRENILGGWLLGILFVFIAFAKAIFEAIFPLFFIPYFCAAGYFFSKRQRKAFFNTLLLVLAAFLTFYTAIVSYKSLNLKYNGHFTLSDRGPWALYGNTARRMEKMTSKRVLAAFAYSMGEGACRSIFGESECKFWSYIPSDNYGYSKLGELEGSGIPKKDIDVTLINLAKKEICSNPPQYLLFMIAEGLKMFFWESTKIGYVTYPPWQERIFNSTFVKNSLRFLIFLITFLSCIHSIHFLRKNKTKSFGLNSADDVIHYLLFSIMFLVFIYVSVHSFFFILTRYALPIAPLYLALIAFGVNKIIFKRL